MWRRNLFGAHLSAQEGRQRRRPVQNCNAEIYLHLQEKSTRRNCQKNYCKLSNPQNANHGYLRSNFISEAFVLWSRLNFCCFGAIFPSVSVMIPTYPPFFRSNSHFLFHKNYKWKFAFLSQFLLLLQCCIFFSTLVVMFPALSLPSQTPAAALHSLTVQYNWHQITFLSQIHISLADQSR